MLFYITHIIYKIHITYMTHITYITYTTYITHITYITYMIKLIFKAYKKTDKIFKKFFFLYIKIYNRILSKTQRKAFKKGS